MKLEELSRLDSTLEIIKECGPITKWATLADPSQVRPSSLLLLKDKKWPDLISQGPLFTDGVDNVGMILTKGLWNRMGKVSEVKKIWMEKVSFIGVTSQFDMTLSLVSQYFYEKEIRPLLAMGTLDTWGVDPTAEIGANTFLGPKVKIGKGAKIYPGVTIMGGCEIGENTEIFPNVTLYPKVKIGNNCRIHSSVVIGGDGYGYNYSNGVHQKIWHFGGVEIHDDVEIGSLSSVDGGTFSPTIIGQGTKIDNQVQIGHNCKIGAHVIICGQAGLSGSGVIGDYTVLGGKAGTAPGIKLERGCQVAGNGMVTSSWPAGSKVAGHPARPVSEWLRGVAYVRRESEK